MVAREQPDDREFFYEGFTTPSGTYVPDDVFDVLAPRLSEAELRVLLYIVRRTFGFGKRADAISLKQLTDGIVARDGRVLDHGTGMSRKGVVGGIKGLLAKGVINVHRRMDERGENQVNVYTLRFREGVGTGGNHPSYPGTPPPVTGGNPQESDSQDSVGQHHAGSPSPTGGEPGVAASDHKDPACGRPDLYEQMKKFGVHHHTAAKLLRECDHRQIEQMVQSVSERLQRGWRPKESVAAWLVAAIRNNYAAPDNTPAAPSPEEAERRAQREQQARELSERERERADQESQRQREEQLQELGIEQNVDKLWQQAQMVLREREQWSAAMALSYLKNIENGCATLQVPVTQRERLLPYQAAMQTALAEVVGAPLRLVFSDGG